MNIFSQFEIKEYFTLSFLNCDIHFSNLTISLFIPFIITIFLGEIIISQLSLVPRKIQAMAEIFFMSIENILRQNIHIQYHTSVYLFFTLYLFIIISNLIGMIPLGIPITSHFAVNLTLSLTTFVATIIFAYIEKGIGLLKIFLPKGVPMLIAPLVIIIEIVSFCIKPLSLATRLTATITAGHIISELICEGAAGWETPLMLCIGIAFSCVEIFIGILQAYIFTYLSCLYMTSMIEDH